MQLDVNKARTPAGALGLQSNQAVAFLAAPAIRSLVSAVPKLRERYLQDVASFTRQYGRAPSEQEKLLILKNKTIESWKGQPGTPPEAEANFVSLVDLLSNGTGIVSGRRYDLDEFRHRTDRHRSLPRIEIDRANPTGAPAPMMRSTHPVKSSSST